MKKCGIDLGSIVESIAGRDKGNIFLVVGTEDKYVYLVDGAMRKIENPKKKKEKHVILTSFFDKNMAERIANKNKITNQDVRKLLKEIIEK